MPGDRSSLEASRNIALYVTIGIALLAGGLEILKQVRDDEPTWLNTANNVLFAGLVIGGVTMGVLFVLHLVSGDKS